MYFYLKKLTRNFEQNGGSKICKQQSTNTNEELVYQNNKEASFHPFSVPYQYNEENEGGRYVLNSAGKTSQKMNRNKDSCLS